MKYAENLASNAPCDQALSGLGIASISSLLQSVNLSANVFNGENSSSIGPDGQQLADYFSQYKSSVGAVAGFGTPAQPGNIFLGYAFFDPSLAGVNIFASSVAQAVILIHEAVHALGNVSDQQAGGSKALTQAIVTPCIPVLGNQLGGLTN